MTSRQHITVTPLTPEEAVRRIPDIYDVFDCQPDEPTPRMEEAYTGLKTGLRLALLGGCVVAVLYAFGIM